jgi:signal peptidase II
LNIHTQIEPGRISEKRVLRACAAAFASLILLDQYSKVLAESHLGAGAVKILPFFNLVHVRNTGCAWGMMSSSGGLLLLISALAFILTVVYIRKLSEGWPERYFALTLVLAGIAGNSIDRIWRGSVVDFLDFHAGGHHWPAFNVADSAICVGVAVFIISTWLRPHPTEHPLIKK